eukprot:3611346-Amphidinium_carterae.1
MELRQEVWENGTATILTACTTDIHRKQIELHALNCIKSLVARANCLGPMVGTFHIAKSILMLRQYVKRPTFMRTCLQYSTSKEANT